MILFAWKWSVKELEKSVASVYFWVCRGCVTSGLNLERAAGRGDELHVAKAESLDFKNEIEQL